MSRAFVPPIVALAVLFGAAGTAMADEPWVQISSPEQWEKYAPSATVACSGTTSYHDGILVVKMKKGDTVVDSANADVNSEGDWSCEFEPSQEG